MLNLQPHVGRLEVQLLLGDQERVGPFRGFIAAIAQADEWIGELARPRQRDECLGLGHQRQPGLAFFAAGRREQLRERGFYIAERSRSNYPNTLPSLASTLNMDYLDNAIATEGWEDARYPELLSLVRGNAVVPMLRSIGYEFVAIASGVFPTELGEADRFIQSL